MLSLKLTAQNEAALCVPPAGRSGSGPPPQPGPIGDLAVTEVTATSAQLTFTAAAHAAIHEYRLDGGTWQALAGSRVVAGLSPETEYAVEVRGRNAGGVGPASNPVEIATSAMRARMVFGAEIRLRIVWEQILRLVFAGLFFAGGLGLKGLFIAHLCSLAVTALLCVRLLARYYDFAELRRGGRGSTAERDTLRAGLSILPSNIIGRLFGDAPALILNLLLPGAAGAAAAGLFTIARKLSSVVQLVRMAFSHVMAPLAASAEREDRRQVAVIYAYSTRLISVIALPLAAVLAAGSSSLLSLFGDQAQSAQAALVVLLFARAAEAALGISSPVLQVVAAFRQQMTASVVGVGAALAMGWLTVGHMDPLTAITLATAIGLVVTAAIPMFQLAATEKLHPFDTQFPAVAIRGMAITIAVGAVALLAGRLPDVIALPLIAVIAVGSIWLSIRFALPEADRASLGKTGRRLRLI